MWIEITHHNTIEYSIASTAIAFCRPPSVHSAHSYAPPMIRTWHPAEIEIAQIECRPSRPDDALMAEQPGHHTARITSISGNIN
jgi:predicted N-formylglutamate amidohydrolase